MEFSAEERRILVEALHNATTAVRRDAFTRRNYLASPYIDDDEEARLHARADEYERLAHRIEGE